MATSAKPSAPARTRNRASTSGKRAASNGAPAAASFRSVLGQTYRLEYSLDLQALPVVWTEADSEIGDGNGLTLSDTNAVDVKRYYRIVAP